MLLLIVVPIYFGLNFYTLWRYWGWMKLIFPNMKKKWPFWGILVIHMLIASSLLMAYYMPITRKSAWMVDFSTYWLCFFVYFLMAIVVVDLIRLIIKLIFFRRRKMTYRMPALILMLVFVVGGSGFFCIYGIHHARDMKRTDYEVSIPKDAGDLDSLNVVLVADQHLGYTFGVEDIRKMVAYINEMDADLVCIAGDFYDNHFELLDDPDGIRESLKSIQSTYGVYACMGNHDVQERLLSGFSVSSYRKALRDPEFTEFLESCNVTILDDEVTLIADSFYLIGRKDYEKPGDGTRNRASIETLMEKIDQTKPVFSIDHEPRALESVANAGVDLNLGGHTHDGQFFPLNLSEYLIWKNPCGCMEVTDGHYSVVTSGIGVYGPAMRVGTDSEVVCIHVTFDK